MKHSACLFVLLIVSAVTPYCQSPIYFNGEEIAENLSFFETCYPRLEGSEQEKKALAYFEEKLSALRIPYDISDFSEMEGGHSFSRSLSVTFPGKSADTFLFVFPLNHPEQAARSGAGGVNLALALGLIKACAYARELHVTVKVLIAGGEYQHDGQAGTAMFLKTFFPESLSAVLYFGFESVPSGILFKTSTRSSVAPYWLIKDVLKTISQTDISYTILGNGNQISRLGFTDGKSLIEPYVDAGFPAIMLTNEETPEPALSNQSTINEMTGWIYSCYLFLFRLMEASLGEGASIAGGGGFPSEWDRHYLFFQIRGKPIIIPELVLIIIYMAILTVPFVYMALAKKRFLKYMGNFLKYSYVILIFFLLIFAFLYLGTEALRLVSGIRNLPDLWKYAPLLLFSLKVAFALALFFPAFRLIRRIRFPRNRNFYSMSAIFFLLASVVFTGLYNISFSYYFVWSFFWAFLFSLFANRYLKLFCFLMSPLWLFKIGRDIFSLKTLPLADYLIGSRFIGNLILAAVLLPYIIMIMRLGFAFSHPRKRVRKALAAAVYSLIGGATGMLFFFTLSYQPFGNGTAQPLSYRDYINLDAAERTVTIESPASLKGLSVSAPDFSYTLTGVSREASFVPDIIPDLLELDIRSDHFLGRVQFNLSLKARGEPSQIALNLYSPDELILYECNFPFTITPSGHTIIIHIGDHPPIPLRVEFTLPGNLNAEMAADITYTSLPYDLALSGIKTDTERRLRIKKTYPLPR